MTATGPEVSPSRGRTFTVRLPPDEVDGPIYLDGFDCLAAIVTRETVADLGEDWLCQGVYVLIGPDDDGFRDTYVGLSDEGVSNRVRDHFYSKPWWVTAVLIRGTHATRPFDGVMARHLESRLFDLLQAAPWVRLKNVNRPSSGRNLSPWDQGHLDDRVIPDIMGVLFTAGLPVRRKPVVLSRLSATGEQVPMRHRGARPMSRQSMRVTDRDLAIFQFLIARGEATYQDIADEFGTTVDSLRHRLPRMQANGFIEHAGRHRLGGELWKATRQARAEIRATLGSNT